MYNKRVLVTGANGFIGSHLARRLLEMGADVSILQRENANSFRINDIIKSLVVHRADIRNFPSVQTCLKRAKPQIVFHLAAVRTVNRDIGLINSMIDTNLSGTINLIMAIVDSKIDLEYFINTGTCEEYGDGVTPFKEDQREIPVSPYSASKIAATYFCRMLFKTNKIPICTLRPFLTYGPYQDNDMFIPSVIEHCLRIKDFPMTDGQQTREFNYVEDIIDAYVRTAMCPNAIGEIINIGNGIEYKIKDIAELVVNMMGNPIRLNIGAFPRRVGETDHFFCSNEKAKNMLGWEPKTNLEDGLKKTIEWYKHDNQQL